MIEASSTKKKQACNLINHFITKFHLNRKQHNAHRAAWILSYGEPEKPYICHHCDNRLCVNPNHLFEGTSSDNMIDASKKGRIGGKKKSDYCSKLSSDEVSIIRYASKNGCTNKSIADAFNVDPSYVSRIVSGEVCRLGR